MKTDRQTDIGHHILNQVAEKDGTASASIEERKTIKYSQLKLSGVPSLRFVPIVMEYFGRWAKNPTNSCRKCHREHRMIQARTTARNLCAFGKNTSQRQCSSATLTQSLRRF